MVIHQSRPGGLGQAHFFLRRADRLVSGLGEFELSYSDLARSESSMEQFCALYLAALRGAGAVLTLAETGKRRSVRAGAWERLCRAVPQLSGWSDYFIYQSQLVRELQRGTVRSVEMGDLSEFRQRVYDFLSIVEQYVCSDCPDLGVSA